MNEGREDFEKGLDGLVGLVEDVEKGLDGLEADVSEVGLFGLVVMEVVESSGDSETSDEIEANDTG